MKNWECVVECLEKNNKEMTLNEICDYIEKHHKEKTINGKTFSQTLKTEIYRYCSQSRSYKEDKEDIFYKIETTEGVRFGLNAWKQYKIEKEEQEEIKQQEKRYREGGKKTVTSEKTVRDSRLRKDYIEYLKNKQGGKIWCEICGQWEEIGEEMLQVHHLIEINGYKEKNKEYSTFDDVIAICPNCHRLIHIFGNIEDVKKIYNKED